MTVDVMRAKRKVMDDLDPGPAEPGAASPASPPSLELNPPPPFFSCPEMIPLALETAQIGIWSWDIAADCITWSSNASAVYGDAGLPLGSTLADLQQRIHVEDRAEVAAALQEMLRTPKAGRIRYRLLAGPRADERWIETVATVVLANGNPSKLLGICWEVTDGARAHRELRIRA